jgi:hypothetical protein
MRTWLTRGVIVAAVAAAAAGLGLAVAGVQSPARTVLVLLFLAAGPAAAVAGLLRGFPLASRLIIAGTADVVIIAAIAIIMLSMGLWSPTGGLLAVAGVTVACFAAQLPPVRRAFAAGWAAVWPGRAERADAGEQAEAGEPGSAGKRAAAEGQPAAETAPAQRSLR